MLDTLHCFILSNSLLLSFYCVYQILLFLHVFQFQMPCIFAILDYYLTSVNGFTAVCSDSLTNNILKSLLNVTFGEFFVFIRVKHKRIVKWISH